MAITGKQNFSTHTAQAFAVNGVVDLKYYVSGGPEDGKLFDIGMAPCSDMSWVEKSGIETHDRVIEAHIAVEQWFCPNAFDLSFYGSSDDVIKKALFVDVKSNDDAYLEGKHVALLANSRDIEFLDDQYEEVHIHNFTEMMWLPINSKTPMTSEITYTNHEFYKVEKEFDQYKLELKD